MLTLTVLFPIPQLRSINSGFDVELDLRLLLQFQYALAALNAELGD
jgi:hypothetical protein